MQNLSHIVNQSVKNKRITSNSIHLFFRMCVITIINLVSVRLLLKALGEVDYGIYNAVAILVTMSTFFSSVLSLSIQRFLSISLGEGDISKFIKIFSHGVNMIVVFSVITFVCVEIFGPWFVHEYMTIPSERMDTALWIIHFSLISFLCTTLIIPFMSVLFACEDMGCYSIISIIDCILKFGVAVFLAFISYDLLMVYGIGLMIVSIGVLLLYAIVVTRRHKECRYTFQSDRSIYRQLFSFSGFTLFGTLANTGIQQGSVLLINVFFGPIANTAFAIAQQIGNAIMSLCNNIAIPFRPAMIRAYAEGKLDYVKTLYYACNKFLYYLSIIVALPLMIEIRDILSMWLDYATEEMVIFSRLTIAYTILLTMNNPITIIVHATGHVAKYHTYVDGLMLFCFPITWILFEQGFPAYFVYITIIITCFLAHIIRLICLNRLVYDFYVRHYVVQFVLPAISVTIMATVLQLVMHNIINNMFARTLLECLLSVVSVTYLVYTFALTDSERNAFKTLVKQKFGRK